MIALILGGAPNWEAEAMAAADLLPGVRRMVVAANLAGVHWSGKLDAWATEHPERLAEWASQRKGPAASRHFVPAGLAMCPPGTEQAADRWNGSSGLYAAQVALFDLGATAIILCGIPMDSEAGHFIHPGSWAGTADYRLGFEAALRECGGRIRSMRGWTAGLFGQPTPEWLAAVENIKPLGSSAPQHLRIVEMYQITNTSKATETFWARDEKGERVLFRVAPGETVTADIDPEQPRFKSGALAAKPTAGGASDEQASVQRAPAKEPNPAHRPLKAKSTDDEA